MLYSYFCRFAPQTRYADFDHAKKQMYKIHQPQRESGYIAKVDYQECADGEGKTDCEMLYTPGPKALAEFQAFTTRQIRSTAIDPPPAQVARKASAPPVQENLELTASAASSRKPSRRRTPSLRGRLSSKWIMRSISAGKPNASLRTRYSPRNSRTCSLPSASRCAECIGR